MILVYSLIAMNITDMVQCTFFPNPRNLDVIKEALTFARLISIVVVEFALSYPSRGGRYGFERLGSRSS